MGLGSVATILVNQTGASQSSAGQSKWFQVVRLWSVILITTLQGRSIFAAVFAGAEVSFLNSLSLFKVVIVFNMLGAVLIIALPRAVQTQQVLSAVWKGRISLEVLQQIAYDRAIIFSGRSLTYRGIRA